KGLEEIEHALNFIGSGIVRREQDRRAHARERRRRSSQRLEAASAAMTRRIDTPAEWVITTFRGDVDGLKAGTISSAPSPIAPKTNPDAQVDIGILQRRIWCSPAKCWAVSSAGLKRGFPNRKGDFSSSSTCVTVNVPVRCL